MSGGVRSHWASIPLGDLVEGIEAGKNLRCEERPPGANERGLIKISAVTWGTFDPNEAKTLPMNFHPPAHTLIKSGDFLISRANTIELVGACVLVEECPNNLFLSDKVLRLLVADELKPWLLQYLRSREGRAQLMERSSGNQLSMRNISQAGLTQIVVPLPPSRERRNIVEKIDSLFARSSRARDELTHIPRLIERYRQAVLEAAFRDAGTTVELGSLIEGIDTGKNLRCEERPPSAHERGIVKVSAVTWGEFDPMASKVPPADVALDAKTIIRPGDFLISRANTLELVGACVIVGNLIDTNLYLSDKVLRLRMPEDVKLWVLWFLRSPQGRQQIESLATGNQLSMRNISQEALRSIELPLPPIEERKAILGNLISVLNSVRSTSTEVARAVSQLQRLDQSVLDRAFVGELVPQDPNDEPAAVLLGRIKAAHPVTISARRGRRPGKSCLINNT